MSSRRQRAVKSCNKSSQSVKLTTETTQLNDESQPPTISRLHGINTPERCNKTTTHARPARCRTIQSANFDSPRIVGRPKQTKSSDDHWISGKSSELNEAGAMAESEVCAGKRQERRAATVKRGKNRKTNAAVVTSSDKHLTHTDNIHTEQQHNKDSTGPTADKIGPVSDDDFTVPVCGNDLTVPASDKSGLSISTAGIVESCSAECNVTPVAADEKQIVSGVLTNVNITSAAADTPIKSTPTATRRRVAASRNRPDTESHKITEFFAVRRSSRTHSARELKEQRELDFQKYVRDNKHDGLEVVDIVGKGRGVVATRPFFKGDFVVEYAGDLISLDAAKNRENKYSFDCRVGCYMYYFQHHDKNYCIDATSETGLLGRLINHSQKKFNCATKVIEVDGRPRLILVCSRDIKIGEELLYDYGDRNKESLDAFPWLAL